MSSRAVCVSQGGVCSEGARSSHRIVLLWGQARDRLLRRVTTRAVMFRCSLSTAVYTTVCDTMRSQQKTRVCVPVSSFHTASGKRKHSNTLTAQLSTAPPRVG